MKKISKQEVKHIADLSRLALTEEELELYSKQLEVILEYMDKLNNIDTTNVEPVSSIIMLYKDVEVNPYYREDVPKESVCREEILQNAPQRIHNYFKVEKVIE
jgi:aspartyl-tRNA(Asn)/glutamyl-tRNA(Gln) amidotransferase subunit C